MTDLAVAQRVYYESDDVDDDDPDPVQSGVDTAILAVSLLETVFDDHHTVVDDDPSFQGGGGGDFGGGGADDSW